MNAPALAHRYEATRGALVGFLRKRAPANQVEELAQETWLRVVRADTTFESELAFRAFVFTVARRLLIDEHRQRLRRPTLVALDESAPGVDFGPDHHLQASRVLQVVHATLAELKPEVAQVFRWRTETSLSFQEIAERQGVGLNTALGRMHQATRRIAHSLQQAGLGPGGTP